MKLSLAEPIMEAATAACYGVSAEKQVSHNHIKTEDSDHLTGLGQSENTASNLEATAASNMANMAAAQAMFNRLQDTANFTTR